MKNSRLNKISSALLSLAMIATLGTGCGKQSSNSSAGGGTVSLTPSGRTVPVSVTTNSFQQVANQIDPGGVFYMYLGTEQFLNGLSGKVTNFRDLLTSIPDMPAADRANVGKLMDVVTSLIKSSGVEEISGVGASGVEIEKGVYLNKIMMHHYPGRNDGLIWTMFGKEPHALTGIEYMPQNTALCAWGDLDAAQVWTLLKQQIQAANIPDLSQGLDQGTKQFERQLGVSLDKVLESLGGEVGFVMTMNPDKKLALPRGNGPSIDIPEISFALVVKTKDETLFGMIDKLMQANSQTIKTDKDGLKMRTMQLPLPLPVRPSVAQAGDYLFVAMTDTMINDMLAVKSGKEKGLKSSDDFKKISKGIALEGNSFSYVSPEISRTITRIIGTIADSQAANGAADTRADLLEKMIGDKVSFSFSVASNTKEGWFVQSHSDQHPAMLLAGPLVVAPTAILAGLTLPALNKAKGKAQNVACINNMKQIGLAARLYANDHNDMMPKTLQDMKDELASPRVLICPNGPNQAKPTSWADFNFSDASYVLVSPGISTTNDPHTVFARCTVHGTVCYLDGSVQAQPQGQAARPPAARAPQP